MSKFNCLSVLFNDLENHRTQSQYDRHRVTKMVLLEFVNNFMSFFYIAFYIQDMGMLKTVSIYYSGVVRLLIAIFQ
jgi:anoctamin-10